MFISPAFAQTTAGAGSFIEAAAPLVLVFGILYFFLIRPQQKRVKEHQAMITAVRRGDTVVTAGGIVHKMDALVYKGGIPQGCILLIV